MPIGQDMPSPPTLPVTICPRARSSNRPPRHQRKIVGPLDHGEATTVQRQHAAAVAGLDVEMFKPGAR
jgi:hypothetical protein